MSSPILTLVVSNAQTDIFRFCKGEDPLYNVVYVESLLDLLDLSKTNMSQYWDKDKNTMYTEAKVHLHGLVDGDLKQWLLYKGDKINKGYLYDKFEEVESELVSYALFKSILQKVKEVHFDLQQDKELVDFFALDKAYKFLKASVITVETLIRKQKFIMPKVLFKSRMIDSPFLIKNKEAAISYCEELVNKIKGYKKEAKEKLPKKGNVDIVNDFLLGWVKFNDRKILNG